MRVQSTAEQLFFTTVKIKSYYPDGQVGTGTGFIFRYINSEDKTSEFLVTNKHVINDPNIGKSTHGTFTFIKGEQIQGDTPRLGHAIQHNIENDYWIKAWFGHPDDKIDVAVFVLGPTANHIQEILNEPIFCRGISSSFIPTDEAIMKLDAIEDILFVGYPNGIWDKVNLLPIIRKGITATPLQIDYEGEPKFLVDASVFGGSSGSPIFVHSTKVDGLPEFLLVGIMAAVYQVKSKSEIIQTSIPTNVNQPFEVISTQMIDLGIAFKSKTIIETIEAFLLATGQASLIK